MRTAASLRNGQRTGKKAETGSLQKGEIGLQVVLSAVVSTVAPQPRPRGMELEGVGPEPADNQPVAAGNAASC